MKTRKYLIVTVLLLLVGSTTLSQNVTGKIIDSNTQNPIPFATVQYAKNDGVVANAEGYFNFSTENKAPVEQLTISCMGYLTTFITVEQLRSQNFVIALEEAVNELGTVYITNKFPSVDIIMKRVQQNLKTNYSVQLTKSTIFSRETSYFKPNLVSLEIDKSTGFSKERLKSTNRQLDSLGHSIVNSAPSHQFKDVLADFYSLDANTSKIELLKATLLDDEKNKGTFDNIQKKATNIILKHLNINKTYKLKTGLFKVEDSLSLKNSENKKEDEKKDIVLDFKQNAQKFLNQYYFDEGSVLDFVKDTSIYEYTIENVTSLDGKPVFVIHFVPKKAKAKYVGRLYVTEEDYAVARIDYQFAEGKKGESLNLKLLFGIKFAENARKVTAIYKKNDATDLYHLSYVSEEIGQYVYVHRPLKFIENGPGKNKVAFDLKLDGNTIEKRELLNLGTQTITADNYNGVKEAKKIEYVKLKQYDPVIWKDYTVIEPLNEMKQFKVEE